jgi:glycosyltransferase involved in cell wall biosynthesis
MERGIGGVMRSVEASVPRSQELTSDAVTGAGEQSRPNIAVIIPCYNEEAAIGEVITRFRHELPHADIHVFDNNSTDRTAQVALQAGAFVSYETRQGKGHVVRAMFKKVDADIYIMVDGDMTYPSDRVHELLSPVLRDQADMVVGSRFMSSDTTMKAPNRLGNWFFRVSINSIFGCRLTDILSGYRVMTREFIRSITVLSEGFQIETELTIQALYHKMRLVEVPVTLSERLAGSQSKISVIADGFRILWTIFDLYRTYRPLTVFGGAGLLLIGMGIILGVIVVLEFIETGLVQRFPTAILASAMVVAGLLAVSVGLILNTLMRSFREVQHKILSLDERISHGRWSTRA